MLPKVDKESVIVRFPRQALKKLDATRVQFHAERDLCVSRSDLIEAAMDIHR